VDARILTGVLRVSIYVDLLIACSIGYQPDGQPPISSTEKPITAEFHIDGTSAANYPPPRRLKTDEISQVVNDFRIAAKNVMEAGNPWQRTFIGLFESLLGFFLFLGFFSFAF
jgi:hypothetical protein